MMRVFDRGAGAANKLYSLSCGGLEHKAGELIVLVSSSPSLAGAILAPGESETYYHEGR